jgi:hypothetical protein
MKIYVASSWRNTFYNSVLATFGAAGHDVWDWRNPPTGGSGFKWADAGLEFSAESDERPAVHPINWCAALAHPAAQRGFASDLAGMNWCDAGVLLHPCGRSAHLEAGWLAGRGKKVHVLALEPVEPDLMVLALNGEICGCVDELLEAL